MSNFITLEDLDAAVQNQFAPLRFVAGDEEFHLRNVLRLSPKERKTVLELLKNLDDARRAEESGESVDVESVVETIETILKTVVADGKGNKLSKVLGGDLGRCQALFQKWAEVTQSGEAQNSPA